MCKKFLSYLMGVSLFQPKFKRRTYTIISLLIMILFFIIAYQYTEFVVYYMPFMFFVFSVTSITDLAFSKDKLEKYFLEINSYKSLKSVLNISFCYRIFFFQLLFLGSIVQLIISIGI